jgi:hypothetical protein
MNNQGMRNNFDHSIGNTLQGKTLRLISIKKEKKNQFNQKLKKNKKNF